MTTNLNNINEIHTSLRAQAGALELEPQEARLFLQVLRELAHGTPVPF